MRAVGITTASSWLVFHKGSPCSKAIVLILAMAHEAQESEVGDKWRE